MVKTTMPDIQGASEVELEESVKKLSLSPENRIRQFTGDGTTPSQDKDSADAGKNSHSSNGDAHTPEKDWSEEVKEGIAPNPTEEEEDAGESADESSDEDSSDNEEIKAPIELIGEFLLYVRTSDWENAAKLCKMILIYEPDNPIALQFQPLITEKAEIEKELAEMSSSSDEDSEDSSDEEDSEDEEQVDDVESSDKKDEEKDDSPDEFEPRPGSKMKNKLVFPHLDPVWKP